MLEINWKSLTDHQISDLLNNARVEQYRRQTIAGAVDAVPEIREAILAAEGQETGGPFVPPTGAHNAYPKGWIVTHDGKEWLALRDGANGTPGDSPDWRQVAEEGEILEWVLPQAGSEYPLGVLVTHRGHVWRNEHEANGWTPGTPHSLWTDLGPVEDYEEGEDPEAPEVPEDPEEPEVPEENEILEWVQPQAGSEYPLGAIVSHEGHVWRNEHEANAWIPGTTGSQWTDLGPVEDYEEEEGDPAGE